MTGTFIRNLNERERQFLLERLSRIKFRMKAIPWNQLRMGSLILGLVIAFGVYFIMDSESDGLKMVILSLLVVGIFKYLSMRDNIKRKNREEDDLDEERKFRRALEYNRAEVARFEAKAVVEREFEEEDDAGPADIYTYYFDIGDNRVLRLRFNHKTDPGDGKFLYYFPSMDEQIWPNDCFEVARTYEHKIWLGVTCHGKKLEPSRKKISWYPDAETPLMIGEGTLETFEEIDKDPIEVWEYVPWLIIPT